LVGELDPSTTGISDQLRGETDEVFSSTVYHEPVTNTHLVTYVVPSKCRDGCKLRSQAFITTRKPILGISRDKKKKPALAQFYEHTKGRPEAQKRSPPSYSCKIKSNRWITTGFSFILDIVRMNSAILVGLSTNRKRKTNGPDFGYELARSLILPLIYSRKTIGLNYTIQAKMYSVTHDKKFLMAGSLNDVPEVSQLQKFDKSGGKKVCLNCNESVKGPGYQAKRAKLTRVMSQCQECGAPACVRKHLLSICTTCYTPPGAREASGGGREEGRRDGSEVDSQSLSEGDDPELVEESDDEDLHEECIGLEDEDEL
jgi:hypothetical protein